MNIFYLDRNAQKAAQAHVDKHVVKMPLETAQILCTALHSRALWTPALTGTTASKPLTAGDIPYKPTHKNHPCMLWASESRANYDWLCQFGLAICAEYTHRYDKTHGCREVIKWCATGNSRLYIPDRGFTERPQCMPDEYKGENAVQAYRRYYCGEKDHIAEWSERNVPEWW
jgi:hypothetical protein